MTAYVLATNPGAFGILPASAVPLNVGMSTSLMAFSLTTFATPLGRSHLFQTEPGTFHISAPAEALTYVKAGSGGTFGTSASGLGKYQSYKPAPYPVLGGDQRYVRNELKKVSKSMNLVIKGLTGI